MAVVISVCIHRRLRYLPDDIDLSASVSAVTSNFFVPLAPMPGQQQLLLPPLPLLCVSIHFFSDLLPTLSLAVTQPPQRPARSFSSFLSLDHQPASMPIAPSHPASTFDQSPPLAVPALSEPAKSLPLILSLRLLYLYHNLLLQLLHFLIQYL